jgi:taurine dioxygenase
MAVADPIEVVPLTATIGAEVRGVDLATAPDDVAVMERIGTALADHLVLVFRGQHQLTPGAQLRFARWFGPLEQHGYATPHPDFPELVVIDVTEPAGLGTDAWHSDSSGKVTPAMGAVLRAVQIPPLGGDTCWASMEAAYEALSGPLKGMLDGLSALHDFAKPLEQAMRAGYRSPVGLDEIRSRHPPVAHPVVRTHPVTGRKSLYVNGNYTTRICELSEGESAVLLAHLVGHVGRPDFQVRLRWEPGTVAFWDNRCTQHYAVADYGGHRRVMHRVSIAGDTPR